MTVFPVNALVASQLEPAEFGMHYAVGSNKHYSGKVIFAELDINFRDPFFDIDGILAETVPDPETGKPKRTKFICSYGVLEHVPLSAFLRLYLVTSNGQVLGLEKSAYRLPTSLEWFACIRRSAHWKHSLLPQRIKESLASSLPASLKRKGRQRICFTQIDFDIDEFFEHNKGKDIHTCQIPNLNPYRLRDCIQQLRSHPDKLTKTLNLGSVLKDVSYALLRHGSGFGWR